MPETNDLSQQAGAEALETLRVIILDDAGAPAARVSAAKILLDRFMPKEDVELKRREADERAEAIAEARCLLAELATAEPVGLHEPVALVADSAAGTDNTDDDNG